jgi:hypothetical protein
MTLLKIQLTVYFFILFSMKAFSQSSITRDIKLDHVLIAVDNLDTAAKEYEGYGFTVVYAGKKNRALNALIFLSDGSLIELIGKDRFPKYFNLLLMLKIYKLADIMKQRILNFKRIRNGLFNFSLYSSNLAETRWQLKKKNIRVGNIVKLSRKRDDLVKIKWDLVGLYPFDLPFFIGEYSPGRLSDSSQIVHSNGATAISAVFIKTRSFDKYMRLYNDLVARQPDTIRMHESQREAIYTLHKTKLYLQECNETINNFGKNDESAIYKIQIESVVSSGQLNPFVELIKRLPVQ